MSSLPDWKKSWISPHSPEAGDPYSIGDIYHRLNPNFALSASSGSTDDSEPSTYLARLEKLSQGWPYMRYLADFMQITCTPPKRHLLTESDKAERASRVKGSLLGFSSQDNKVEQRPFTSVTELLSAVEQCKEVSSLDTSFLFVIEDLSRDVIEILGSSFHIDPHFFRGHINDYQWYNIRDPWVELPGLELFAKQKNYFHLRFIQPRYFRGSSSLLKARFEAGKFNVLRRIDVENDRSQKLDEAGSSVGLVRCKASLWTRLGIFSQTATIGILLLDPPITEGYPLWGGHNYFFENPETNSMDSYLKPHWTSSSIYEDFIHWTESLSEYSDFELDKDPRMFAFTVLVTVVAEWKITLEYANTRLIQIEWEVENPSFHLLPKNSSLDQCLKRLHRWRRVLPIYSGMISDILSRVVTQDYHRTGHASQLKLLAHDFKKLMSKIVGLQKRAEGIANLVGSMISIEENRKAVEQNVNLTRLTYLASVFIPLTFTASLFSMTSDLSHLKETFWIYFAVAVPLTIICLVVTLFFYTNKGNVSKRLEWLNKAGSVK